ncbi:MAG: hypothetical protein WCK33_02440 [Phycisphaerae bacterium]
MPRPCRKILCPMTLLLIVTSRASATEAYTALGLEFSTDNIRWARSIQVRPGSQVNVRVTASYDGPQTMHGLAWVNFQPLIRGWSSEQDRVLPFVASGSQQTGQVAFDKPEPGQAGFGRIFPFAATTLGPSPGGFDTTLATHVSLSQGDRLARLAQIRTTNDIGQGPLTGPLAFNNTNGAGGIVCAQAPAESQAPGLRSTATNDLTLFKFGIIVDPSITDRTLQVELPAAGISRFGTGGAVAGWFTTAAQSAGAVAYVPVISRGGAITVRGAIPAPGPAMAAGALAAMIAVRRQRPRPGSTGLSEVRRAHTPP